jgi:aminoglycoside phosphotransferase (APT) family kinase protein
MLVCLRQQPWMMVVYGRLLADIQATINACAAPDLPLWKERLERDIRTAPPLTESSRQAALQALASLPGGSTLCHGDFHPDNVIMTRRGPVVIDWMTAVCGNSAADVARTSVLLSQGEIPPGTPARALISLFRSMFHRAYLNHYLHRSHLTRAAVTAWELPIVAARLNEGIESEQASLLRLVTLHAQSA